MTKGERIKAKRLEKGYSQTELAQLIKVSKQSLYKYENDIITNIPSDKVEALAHHLDVEPFYIMGWDAPTPTPDLTGPEASLIGDFRTLNDTGKAEAQKRVHELTMIEDYTQEGEAKKDGPASA